KILQSASSLVFMFHSHGTSRPCRQSCMTSDAGLDARLFIRADDVVPATKRFALPRASVQVQDTFAFSENFGSRGKIQYWYRQGLIASVSRIRQTVLGLIDRPKSVEARSAKSAVDSRLSGNLV